MPAGRSSPTSNVVVTVQTKNSDQNADQIDEPIAHDENAKEPLNTTNQLSTTTNSNTTLSITTHNEPTGKPISSILKKPSVDPYVPVYKQNFVAALKALPVDSIKNLNDSKIPDEDENLNETSFEEISDSIQEEPDKEEAEEEDQTFEYTDDDLDEALLAEQDNSVASTLEDIDDKELEEDPITPINTPKNMEASFDMVTGEGHYMPMTPKKSLLSSSASASETSILAMDILNSIKNSTEITEENPYIEMTHGISDPSDKTCSAYELVMVSGGKEHNEPLYMELSQDNREKVKDVNKLVNDGKTTIKKSTLKRHNEKSSSRKNKRNDLPDILKQSQQNYMKSDSSDADDEASKDLSAGMKSRTRFSLSDTFRPASYYLGASTSSSIHKNSPLAECLDSSDSEIVSPPPIPTSPPPMEELNNAEDFSSENFDTIKRMKDIKVSSSENIHHRTLSTSSNPLSESSMVKILDSARNSRLSLPEHLFKPPGAGQSNSYLNLTKNVKLFSTASNCSINTDDGSNTSSDFDLYNKIKLQSPSISADSLNQSQLSLESIEKKPRPKPVSDETLFNLEDTSGTNDKLDHYLNKLENSDLYLYNNEQTHWMNESLKNMPAKETYLPHQHYENMNLTEEALKITKKSSNQSLLYYDSLEDVSTKNSGSEMSLQPLKEQNLSIHDANYDTEDLNHQKFQIDVGSIDLDQQSACTLFEMTQPSHSRQNSNLSDSAPYYYSDLMFQAQPGPSGIAQKLNNQRDISESSKKNSLYISHIHNLINSGNKQQLTSILSSAAEKDQTIDSRNIYESGSGRLNKFIEKTETTTSFANKIYYNEKQSNVDVVGELGSRKNSECDEMWEEDAIWRESLRRVSQRHARSLDDLDRIGSLSPATAGTSKERASRISDADRQWGIVKNSPVSPNSTTSSEERYERQKKNPKISREVTYVNDGLSHQYQRSLTKKKNVEGQASPGKVDNDENDVYVQLACSNEADPASDVYEILREDVQNKNSIAYSSSSFDIDRENIRQWDLMSSGLVKTSSGQNKVLKGSFVAPPATLTTPNKPPLPAKGQTTTLDAINGNSNNTNDKDPRSNYRIL